MGSKEVEGLGPDELLLLLLSSRAEDCSGRVSRAARTGGREPSSPPSLLSGPGPPLTATRSPEPSHLGAGSRIQKLCARTYSQDDKSPGSQAQEQRHGQSPGHRGDLEMSPRRREGHEACRKWTQGWHGCCGHTLRVAARENETQVDLGRTVPNDTSSYIESFPIKKSSFTTIARGGQLEAR